MTGGKLWAELDEKGGADPHLLAADQNLNVWRESSNQQVLNKINYTSHKKGFSFFICFSTIFYQVETNILVIYDISNSLI